MQLGILLHGSNHMFFTAVGVCCHEHDLILEGGRLLEQKH
jgi:hypothetical protein